MGYIPTFPFEQDDLDDDDVKDKLETNENGSGMQNSIGQVRV